ncbi:MAG: hypothetical protein ACKO0Z_15755, partial [Betaproteobacteria bacterium]
MIKKKQSVHFPFQPLVPRDYINAAIIEAGKWGKYVCRKIWLEPKGDTNVIQSARFGFNLAKFGFSARAVEAAREWLAKRHTAKRKRFINDRVDFLYDQLLTPRLPVWKHYR